jgi:histidyl-tRNA synthetase
MGSLLGGGRYDELVGMFAGQPVPTVGLAFGIERLHDVMAELGMGPQSATLAEVFVTLFPETAGAALHLATELRAAGINVETALNPDEKLGRQFKHADRKGIPLALVLGPDEAVRNEVVLRNMRTGEQRSVERSNIVAVIRANGGADGSS